MRRHRGLHLFVLLLAAVALSLGQAPGPPQRIRNPTQGNTHANGPSRELAERQRIANDISREPPERVLIAGDPQDECESYTTLDDGSLYAGLVLSVTVKSRKPPEDPFESGLEERGTFRFRVDRTVNGPRQKELTLGYWSTPEQNFPNGGPILTADWGGAASPWGHRPPRPGEHLLLLLTADKMRAENLNGVGGGPVWQVWRGVGAGHGLVRGFEDATEYLKAKDDRTRDELFRKLCRSDFRSMRRFAFYAAFYPADSETHKMNGGGHDPVRQSRLVLEFLRLAVPRMDTAMERVSVTGWFSRWLEGFSSAGVTEALLSAFEQWYLAELETGNVLRCQAALEGLKDLIAARGLAGTVALFKKSGRAGLEKSLRGCAGSWDPSVQQSSRALLRQLGRK